MQIPACKKQANAPVSKFNLFTAWRKDTRGVTAVEFGFVAIPFLMFIFGIINIALHFFYATTIEKGLESSARKIRTGQAQTSNMTIEQFRQDVCNEGRFQTGLWLDCNKLRIHMQSDPDFAFDAVDCLNNGGLGASTGNPTDGVSNHAGGASTTVLVVACYERSGSTVPWFSLSNMNSDSSQLIQVSTTFRTEPYAEEN
jgi:Flp pilus assembly protein TadG